MHGNEKFVTILSVLFCSLFALQGVSQASKPYAWSSAGQMTQARTGAAAVLLSNGWILITGGMDSGGVPQATAELYNPAAGTFSAAPSMNVPRAHHAAIVLTTGDVLVTGGSTTGGGYSDTAEIYRVNSQQWTLLEASLGTGLEGHAMANLSDGNVLIAGGQSTAGTVTSLLLFNLSNQTISPIGNLITARTGAAAAATPDGRVLIVGGTDINNAVLASTEIFTYTSDTMTGTVSAGPAMTYPRTAATATTTYDGVAVIDGNNGTADLGTAEIFSQWTKTFKVVSGGTPRSQHFAVLLPSNGSILAMGGTGGTAVDMLEPWANSMAGAFLTSSALTNLVAPTNLDGGFAAPASLGYLLAASGMGDSASAADLFWFPTISTDKPDYAPGTQVIMTGSGFQPGETVDLHLHIWVDQTVQDPPDYTATADTSGNFTFTGYAPNTSDVGARYHLTAVGESSGHQAQTIFTDSNGSATQLAFTSSAMVLTAGSCSTAITVATENSSGVAKSPTSSFTLDLSSTSSGGKFYSDSLCTASITKEAWASGVGSVTFYYADTVSGTPTLTADTPSSHTLTSATQQETVNAAAPSQLAFNVQPSTTTAGAAISPAVTVQVEDSYGNVVTGDSSSVSMTISGGGLTGTKDVGAVSGVATFSNLVPTLAGSVTLFASDSADGLTKRSSSFTVNPGAASQLAFNVQPSPTTAGVAISPAVTVQVEDSYGNVVTGDSSSVSMTISGGGLTGTKDVGAVSGVATFSNLVPTLAGSVTLFASDSTDGLTKTKSSSFTVNPGAASQLAFNVQPSPTTAGVAISPAVTVQVEDSYGNVVTGDSSSVSMTISGGGLTGTKDVGAVSGVATFSNLVPTLAGSVTLIASDSADGLTKRSSSFTVNPGAASQLAFNVQPSPTTAGVAISPAVTVQVEDSYGNVVISDNTSAVTMTISGSGLIGTKVVTVASGVATFNDLVPTIAGSVNLFAGDSTDGLTRAKSRIFTVNAGAASQLAFNVQPSPTTAGVAISPAVTVQVEDSYGNVVTSDTSNVTMTISGGGLTGTKDVGAVSGVATFSNLVPTIAGGVNLFAHDTSDSLPDKKSDSFTVSAGALASFLVTATTPVYTNVADPLTITALDYYGNTVASYNGSPTLTSTAGTAATFSTSTPSLSAGVGTATVAFATAGTSTVTATDGAVSGTSGNITVNSPPSYVVTTANDSTGACTNQNASGATRDASCSLRDALAASQATETGTITFDSTAFSSLNSSSANTITLTNGTLSVPPYTTITGPTANSGYTRENLVTVDGGGLSGVFTVAPGVQGAVISNLTIQNGNSSSNGGGIENDGTLTLTDDTISNNAASGNGGGINSTGVLKVIASTLSGNTATSGNGGGINSLGTSGSPASLTLIDTTLSGNSAVEGGGVYNDANSTLTVSDSTLSNNTATTASGGGGIYNNNASTAPALANGIISNNSANSSADDVDGGYTGNTGNVVGVSGGSAVNANAISLAPLGNYGGPTQTLIPLPGSPAICAGAVGSIASGVTTDQRGLPNSNTSYPNYSSPACVDAGAVQTNYALSFTTEPSSSVQANVAFTSSNAPQVTLTESGSTATFANSAFSASGSPGALSGSSVTFASGVGSYSGLSVTTGANSEQLTATLSLNAFLSTPLSITATSNTFDVIAITLSPASLSSGTVEDAYSVTFTASGGTSPYTYALATGSSLPAGLSLNNSTGELSGTPTAGGTFSITVKVTDSDNYSISQLYTLTIAPPTITLTPATLLSGTYGASYDQSVSASGGTAPYTYALASGSSLPPGLSLSSSGAITGTPTAASTSAYTFTIIATDSSTGTGPYTGSQLISLTINQANATINVTPYTVTYDGNSHTATGTATGVGSVNLAADLTLSGTAHTGAGTYATDAWSFNDPNGNYANANGTVSDKINQASSAVSVTPSINPVLLQNPVTYTATVSSTAGKPTGTITFEDGGGVLAACTGVVVTTATGMATCVVTYTATGTHSITAVYNGDSNFLTNTSSELSEAAIDITLGSPVAGGGTSSSETILPGGTATYSFPIAPSSGTTFPVALTLTVTGLPTGATATLAPSSWSLTSSNPWTWTLPSNTSLTGNTVLTIRVPQTTAEAQPSSGAGGNQTSRIITPFALALALLPFACRLRKAGKRFSRMLLVLLLLIAGMAAVAGLSGCGSSTGFFVQAQKSYTVTVTVSYGSLSHITTGTLTVE
jgi:hypothetical protein